MKARADFRSNKTDLALKQGECLDIIRVQGNPEGKWLGRTQDGSSEFTYFIGLIFFTYFGLFLSSSLCFFFFFAVTSVNMTNMQ